MNQQAGAKQTGFTLVEVLVVVVIIGILASLAVPAIFVAMRKVEDGTAIVEVKLVAQALDAYKVEYGEYPPDFTNHQHVIDHLNRIFPRRREWQQPSDVLFLDPHQALLFWLRGFFANPEYPITGDINGDGIPDSERKPFVEFNVAMIVAFDSDGDGNKEDPDTDLDLDTPGEILAPSKMPQSPIVYFDSRSDQGAVSSYQLGNNPKSSVLAGNGGTAMPYMWSETYTQPRKKYVNPDSFQLISAGRDGHFGDPNDNGKWYPEGFNYDEYDADNITSFSTNTLGNSIP